MCLLLLLLELRSSPGWHFEFTMSPPNRKLHPLYICPVL